MTGEVTLAGQGSAHRRPQGKSTGCPACRTYTKVIIPDQNKKDLVEIPKNIRQQMTFFPVKDMDEVIAVAFGKGIKSGNRKG